MSRTFALVESDPRVVAALGSNVSVSVTGTSAEAWLDLSATNVNHDGKGGVDRERGQNIHCAT